MADVCSSEEIRISQDLSATRTVRLSAEDGWIVPERTTTTTMCRYAYCTLPVPASAAAWVLLMHVMLAGHRQSELSYQSSRECWKHVTRYCVSLCHTYTLCSSNLLPIFLVFPGAMCPRSSPTLTLLLSLLCALFGDVLRSHEECFKKLSLQANIIRHLHLLLTKITILCLKFINKRDRFLFIIISHKFIVQKLSLALNLNFSLE